MTHTHAAPSVLEIEVHSRFLARHSLPGFETPHHHWFGVVLTLRPEAKQDIARIEMQLNNILSAIDRTDLNVTLKNEQGTVLAATVENIALWIWKEWMKQGGHPPRSVKVSNANLDGVVLGSAMVGVTQ